MSVSSTSHSCLHRWSHSATAIGDERIFIFGGYGCDVTVSSSGKVTLGKCQRLATVALYHLSTGEYAYPTMRGIAPAAREHHSADSAGAFVVVCFGRSNPQRSFNDIHVCDVNALSWIPQTRLILTGDDCAPRYRHRTYRHAHYIIVTGGRTSEDDGGALADLILDVSALPQRIHVTAVSSRLCRHSHALFIHANTLFAVGGRSTRDDRTTSTVMRRPLIGDGDWSSDTEVLSAHIFSHTAHVINDHLILIGGCDDGDRHAPYKVRLLNLASKQWRYKLISDIKQASVIDALLVKHTAFVRQRDADIDIVIVGGGGAVFHNGNVYNPTITLCCSEVGGELVCRRRDGAAVVDLFSGDE